MSPTVFRYKGYRFFFFSREEERMHVHVESGNGEAKFWIEPSVSLAQNYGFSEKELKEIARIVEDRENEIRESWERHFSG